MKKKILSTCLIVLPIVFIMALITSVCVDSVLRYGASKRFLGLDYSAKYAKWMNEASLYEVGGDKALDVDYMDNFEQWIGSEAALDTILALLIDKGEFSHGGLAGIYDLDTRECIWDIGGERYYIILKYSKDGIGDDQISHNFYLVDEQIDLGHRAYPDDSQKISGQIKPLSGYIKGTSLIVETYLDENKIKQQCDLSTFGDLSDWQYYSVSETLSEGFAGTNEMYYGSAGTYTVAMHKGGLYSATADIGTVSEKKVAHYLDLAAKGQEIQENKMTWDGVSTWETHLATMNGHKYVFVYAYSGSAGRTLYVGYGISLAVSLIGWGVIGILAIAIILSIRSRGSENKK